MPELTTEQQLNLISKAWGKQKGYVFFPWISGDAKDKVERIKSYHEGRAYKWPKDESAILAHMREHINDDLYWCPSIFEKKRRVLEYAMDEHCLWADLDKIDPREIDYEPTIAWESSPNRYQGIWLISGGDLQGASWPGNENQRLTYYIGADPSGWDTTQLLRIPGWKNHKPEYRVQYGEPPIGQLLWSNRRRYLADDFDDLPEVTSPVDINLALDDEIDAVDRQSVWARVRLKLSTEVRQIFAAKETSGDRSETLWRLERDLADVGCTVTEIVALIRPTVWNKYAGRQDEIRRLITEASKAVAHRSEETTKQLEVDREPRPRPQRLGKLIAEAPTPKWLVKDIWGEASCGFIAGQPKSYKSWMALDLALSVATGAPFLDRFDVVEPGPVLYIQEEDPISRVKTRLGKIWPGKRSDRLQLGAGRANITWLPPQSEDEVPDPEVSGYIREGVTISTPEWQAWLDEVLDEGFEPEVNGVGGKKYKMILLDPLMMIAGEVDENRSMDMTERLFKPLKQLAEKHQVAVVIVHHMRKGDPKGGPQRGGQLLLGSVANHAWSEDALYVKRGPKAAVTVELESKNGIGGSFQVHNLKNSRWQPRVGVEQMGADDEEDTDEHGIGRKYEAPPKRKGKAHRALDELGVGVFTTRQVADAAGIKSNAAYRQLSRLCEDGKAKKVGSSWTLVK